jgi:hypothetical protein
MRRYTALPLLVILAVALSFPKDRKDKHSALPADVLRARTVLVVIAPTAGEPFKDPQANARAQDEVEKAFMRWRRFEVVSEPSLADLVVSVRAGTGKVVSPTMKGGPIDQRPVILQPTDGSIRIGGHQGQSPDASGRDPIDAQPHLGTEYGQADDTMEVYRGKRTLDDALDSPPVWRYIAKDSLKPPKVSAVEKFRKVLDESEKADPKKSQP